MPEIRKNKQAFLIVLRKEKIQTFPLWQWPAVLGIDTVAVILLWLALFSEVLYIPLDESHYLLAGGASWIFIAGSRGALSWRSRRELTGNIRIDFFRIERDPILILIPVITLSLFIIAINRLRSDEQLGLIALGSAALIYFLCLFLADTMTRSVIPRELSLPLFFGGMIAALLLPNSIFPPLFVVAPLTLFILLLTLSFWISANLENEKSQADLSVHFPSLRGKVRWLCWLLAVASLSLVIIEGFTLLNPLLVAIAAGAINMFILEFFGEAFPGMGVRALSRLLLTTPLVPLGFQWLLA